MGHYRETRALLVPFFVLAFALTCHAYTCPVSTCDPSDPNMVSLWLNTTTTASRIRGLEMRSFPMMPNGQAFLDAYGSFSVVDILELPAKNGACNPPKNDQVYAEALKYVNMKEACCETILSWDMLEPNINRSVATVYLTRPDWPSNFSFVFNFSLVNESINIPKEGSPNTWGYDYNMTYSVFSGKLTVELANWPWVVTEPASPSAASYLRFIIKGIGTLDEPGTMIIENAGISSSYISKSKRATVEFNFLNVFTVGEVDHLNNYEPRKPLVLTGIKEIPEIPELEFGVTFCQNKTPIPERYTLLTYDPTLSALFVPDASDSPQKKPLSPAAYAVPIAVVVVAVIVILVVFKSKAIRYRLFGKPDSLKQANPIINAKEDLARSSTNEPLSAGQPIVVNQAQQESSASEKRATGWARATRPAQP